MQGFTGSRAHLDMPGIGIEVGEAMQRDQCLDEGNQTVGEILDAQLMAAEILAQYGGSFQGEY